VDQGPAAEAEAPAAVADPQADEAPAADAPQGDDAEQ
jgi:hypothetical protein